MTHYVVDASVAAKWHFPEELSDRATGLLSQAARGEVALSAPDLLVYEFGSVVVKKLRRRMVRPEDAEALLSRFPPPPLALRPATEVAPSALRVARAVGATFYDAVYVAVAESLRAQLVTADADLVEQVRRGEFAGMVLELSELPT